MSGNSHAPLVLKVAGQEIPLLRFLSKRENECYGVLAKKANGERYLSPYGVQIPALAKDLPAKAVLVGTDGKTVDLNLELGYKDDGLPKRFFNAKVNVPGVGDRMVKVNLSQTKSGWNLIAKAIPGGEGGSKVTSIADLW
jgi:hypothetical protein